MHDDRKPSMGELQALRKWQPQKNPGMLFPVTHRVRFDEASNRKSSLFGFVPFQSFQIPSFAESLFLFPMC
jgi:hypothetical protein